MLGGLLTMSARELDRLGVIRRVLDGRMRLKTAAEVMGITTRQARRLCRAYEAEGAKGLVSKARGKASKRKLTEDVQKRAVDLVRERYADFGPTLAAEKLAELHGIAVSRETLRHWMKSDGLWITRKDRVPKPHQPRFRRECLGELVQIDGCEHHWFEDRGPYCTLLVYVDDATGRLMELLFAKSESAFSYFEATASYINHHGKPVAFYSDKHRIFRINRKGIPDEERGVTQFGRALSELNIDIICANSNPGRAAETARALEPQSRPRVWSAVATIAVERHEPPRAGEPRPARPGCTQVARASRSISASSLSNSTGFLSS